MFDLNFLKGITQLVYLPGDLEDIIILQYSVPTLFSTFDFPLKDVLIMHRIHCLLLLLLLNLFR